MQEHGYWLGSMWARSQEALGRFGVVGGHGWLYGQGLSGGAWLALWAGSMGMGTWYILLISWGVTGTAWIAGGRQVEFPPVLGQGWVP